MQLLLKKFIKKYIIWITRPTKYSFIYIFLNPYGSQSPAEISPVIFSVNNIYGEEIKSLSYHSVGVIVIREWRKEKTHTYAYDQSIVYSISNSIVLRTGIVITVFQFWVEPIVQYKFVIWFLFPYYWHSSFFLVSSRHHMTVLPAIKGFITK